MDNMTSIAPNQSPIVINATLNQLAETLSTLLKDWLPLIIFATTIFLSILAWYLNERAKRSNKIYLQKETRYLELAELIENLKENEKPGDPDLKPKFIHQINLCWLYCPDNVVRMIIDLVSKFNNDASQNEREETIADLMVTLRKDLRKRTTKLNRADYAKVSPAMLRRFVLKAESGDFKIRLGDITLTHSDSGGNVIPPSEDGSSKNEHPRPAR
jgi:hypothetical protein